MYFGGSKASVFKKLQGINYLHSSIGNTYANEKLAGGCASSAECFDYNHDCESLRLSFNSR